jgi:hypothetical protein
LATDRGKSYELKEWDDLETGTMVHSYSRGSHDGGIESGSESTTGNGLHSLWKKAKSAEDSPEKKDDMVIKCTSEVELHVTSAGGSRRPA